MESPKTYYVVHIKVRYPRGRSYNTRLRVLGPFGEAEALRVAKTSEPTRGVVVFRGVMRVRPGKAGGKFQADYTWSEVPIWRGT